MRNFVLFGFLVFVLVFGFFFFFGDNRKVSLINEPNEVVVEKPVINVREVSHKVAVGKPDVVLFQEALKESSERSSSELTIYNNEFGLVKDVRRMNLEKGVNLVEFKDVPSSIEPESVVFTDKTFPSTFVLEQSYGYDLLNSQKLLSKYVGKEIVVVVNEGDSVKEYRGILLSGGNSNVLNINDPYSVLQSLSSNKSESIILQTNDGVIVLNNYSKIVYPQLPYGLLTKPTLVWKVYSENSGVRDTETMYISNGLGWSSDYVAIVNADDSKVDLKGWATINNNSGTSYSNVSLKLVAGEVNKLSKFSSVPLRYDAAYSSVPKEQQFSQEQFFEYYLYSLDRPTDLLNNESKQISLLSANNISVKKEFVFDNTSNYYYYVSNQKSSPVQIKLTFNNSRENNLGVALPKGVVKVYKRDSQGKLQFIGEDQISHTKANDELSVFLGKAFDVSASRVQESVDNISDRVRRETYRITIENEKGNDIVVKVKEPANAFSEWEILKSSLPFEKKSSSEFDFLVKVPAKGKAELTYTIEYRS
ncbi:MAG: DUF4139 domain-containing protein [Candidatus Diapherotrites archaeon]